MYRLGELELMTTHQLREICRREKIIQGIINPLDKEELLRVIMRYRGTREQFLIQKKSDTGIDMLELLFPTEELCRFRINHCIFHPKLLFMKVLPWM